MPCFTGPITRGTWHNLQQLCPNFTYLATIDQPKDEPIPWNGYIGWVQNLWKEGVLAKAWGFQPTKDDTDVFLCGNPAMIEEMLGILEKDGFSEHTRKLPGQVHIERFRVIFQFHFNIFADISSLIKIHKCSAGPVRSLFDRNTSRHCSQDR